MKRYIILACMSILFSTLGIDKVYGADGSGRLKWRFDFYAFGTAEYYQPRLMISYGPVSIGTAYRYDFGEPFTDDVMGEDYSWFSINDTIYTADVRKGTPHGYFPLLIRYTPYLRSFGFGEIGVYGFFHASLWSREEWLRMPIFYKFYERYDYQIHRYVNQALIQFNPFCWYKIGVGFSFNPLRFIPFDISIGYLRTYYPYDRVPEPYRDHISHTSSSGFYLSLMFSLGYQSAGKRFFGLI